MLAVTTYNKVKNAIEIYKTTSSNNQGDNLTIFTIMSGIILPQVEQLMKANPNHDICNYDLLKGKKYILSDREYDILKTELNILFIGNEYNF